MQAGKSCLIVVGTVLLVLNSACKKQAESEAHFVVVGTDRQITGDSKFPVAIDPGRLGKYPVNTKSGAGYFYDDVLEYRVWLHPDKGALSLNGHEDYFLAFAQYEPAKSFSERMPGSEPPLVLVRQLEWINEPTKGQFIPMKSERITEWRVVWLKDSKRTDKSIEEFLRNPRSPQKDDLEDTQE
jgi:putative acetyltransferase